MENKTIHTSANKKRKRRLTFRQPAEAVFVTVTVTQNHCCHMQTQFSLGPP